VLKGSDVDLSASPPAVGRRPSRSTPPTPRGSSGPPTRPCIRSSGAGRTAWGRPPRRIPIQGSRQLWRDPRGAASCVMVWLSSLRRGCRGRNEPRTGRYPPGPSSSRTRTTRSCRMTVGDTRSSTAKLEVSPAPSTRHQGVLGNSSGFFTATSGNAGSAASTARPSTSFSPPSTVVQPDLVFVAPARRRSSPSARLRVRQTLPSRSSRLGSTHRDRVAKAALYARYGIRQHWVVDPDARILEVYELEGAGYRLVGRHESAAIVRTPAPRSRNRPRGVWV